MRHGSLFSGIGGFDLAAEWMGWENVFHCEWNPFGQRVLKHYWPNAESFTDITKTDFTKYHGTVDIITGGFPCQPYSSAGKRLGKEDERHLWPEMLRAIREVSPSFVVGENVRGLTNWNGGLVFDEVCTELESYGYSVAPVIIPACAVNAPHKRERIWFVAKNTMRSGLLRGETNEKRTKTGKQWHAGSRSANGVYLQERVATDTNISAKGPSRASGSVESNGGNGDLFKEQRRESPELNNRLYEFSRNVKHANGIGQERGLHKDESKTTIREQFGKRNARSIESSNWDNFPTQPPLCGGDDGIPTELDGVAFSKWRAESVKAYGNAIVPQVAYEIFKAINLTT